jgi:hypothetical protein
MNANKQRSCAHGQIWSQHAEIQNSRVGFNMMEQINALVLTNFYLPFVLHLLSPQKGGKCS